MLIEIYFPSKCKGEQITPERRILHLCDDIYTSSQIFNKSTSYALFTICVVIYSTNSKTIMPVKLVLLLLLLFSHFRPLE